MRLRVEIILIRSHQTEFKRHGERKDEKRTNDEAIIMIDDPPGSDSVLSQIGESYGKTGRGGERAILKKSS
ncbi:hypothetical protein GWI33_011650 [Rhynchophorus ferrugineus]|uniref:Uncharacterized protein n=1 Tax=Rhynchophorus ferrugineus TaxID=354439 RepID=A0A834MBE7_RHYFE|nr:hypothetical protein GWI33_011650 [Rhynchophorus ferrugineus]